MSTAASETYPSSRALVRLVLQSALPRPQKAVLQALLAYARPDLTVYHAQGQLAWACDYTRPVIKQALAALKTRAILRVLQRPHQHYSTEYAIDLSRLPSRAPYGSHAVDGDMKVEDRAVTAAQGVTELPADEVMPFAQSEMDLPSGSPGGQSVPPSRQLANPQVVQVVQEKIFFSPDGLTPPKLCASPGHHSPHTPQLRRPRPPITRPAETPAPETLPLTDTLRSWASEAVPGLSLDRERDKFLCYARAHGLTNVDWSEALKGWWLEAHARAVRRGEVQLPAAPRPAPAPEPLPLYDAELHAQMQTDIARLCGTIGQSMAGTNDHQRPRRRHALSILTAEGATLDRDPAYLAQIRARKATLQAQAMLLRAQESCLDAAEAAD